jgi:tetratricopeptide (TPR) repeat protein
MTRGKTGRDTAGTLIAEVEAARRTNPGEAWERLERGFAPAVRDAGEFRRGELWRLRGHVLRAIRRVREALVAYRRAERCFARAGDLREQGRCAMGLIEAYMYLGRYDDAEKAATLGRRRLQRAGDRLALARLLNNVGNLYHRRDRPDLALGCYRRAHGVMSRAGEARAAAVIENNVGNCLALLGRLGAARATYRRARVTHQRMGFPLDVLQADYGLAYLGFLELDHERALDALARVRLDARDHGVPALMALSVLDRAEILLRLGAHDDALEEAGTAIRECGGLKLGYETAKAETFAALAEYRSGRTHAARARLERTLAAFDAEGNRVWAGEALMGLATLAWDRRQALAAAALLAAAARCFAAARDTEREGCALALLVRARVAAGEPAAPALRRATALARSRGSSRLRHLVWSSSALVAGRHGRRAEARHALRRAALESERLAARILDEQWRASFWGDWGWPHEQLAELELAAGRVEPAFDALERGRGRTLLGRGGRALSRPVLEWAGAQDARDRERSRHAGPSAARPGGVRRTVRIPRALAAVPPASIRAATLRRTARGDRAHPRGCDRGARPARRARAAPARAAAAVLASIGGAARDRVARLAGATRRGARGVVRLGVVAGTRRAR